MKKLVLHHGLQKTSSTSIQETFLYNPAPLAAANFAYAKINWPDGRRNSNHSFPLIVGFSDGWQSNQEITRRGWQPKGLKQHFTSEVQRVLDTDQNLIISGEDITDIPEAGLRRFSALAADKGFAVRPVMFVRPPLEFVTSMSQTRVRHGQPYHLFKVGKCSKVEMSLRIWPDLLTLAFKHAIRHPFGPFGSLVDVCHLPSADQFNRIKSNESMSEYATRIIGHLNSQIPLFVGDAVNPLRTYLDTEPLARIRGPKFALTRAEFITIRTFLLRENEALATLLGPEYCDPTFSFQDAPQPWTAGAITELGQAMQSLTTTLQDCIRSYFTTSPDVSAAERTLAVEILGKSGMGLLASEIRCLSLHLNATSDGGVSVKT